MFDTLKPIRKLHSGKVRTLYPCTSCHTTLVRKKGGMCRTCRILYQKKLRSGGGYAIDRTIPRSIIAKHLKPVKKSCEGTPYWKVDKNNYGRCIKFKPRAKKCGTTNQPCPFAGIRDFQKLQDEATRKFNEEKFLNLSERTLVKDGVEGY